MFVRLFLFLLLVSSTVLGNMPGTSCCWNNSPSQCVQSFQKFPAFFHIHIVVSLASLLADNAETFLFGHPIAFLFGHPIALSGSVGSPSLLLLLENHNGPAQIWRRRVLHGERLVGVEQTSQTAAAAAGPQHVFQNQTLDCFLFF